MQYETVILILDLFGTMIFAVTGAGRAIRYRLDLLGVVVLACCVGVGGGIVRDVIIGIHPVSALRNESYLLICIFTGLLVFFTEKYWMKFRNILQVCDAIGLGVFTAIGAQKGLDANLGNTGIILCGVFTAVGGGVIRDIFTGTVPVILHSDFYATASLIGGILFCMLVFLDFPFFTCFLVTASLVTILRLFAIHYRMHLPSSRKNRFLKKSFR